MYYRQHMHLFESFNSGCLFSDWMLLVIRWAVKGPWASSLSQTFKLGWLIILVAHSYLTCTVTIPFKLDYDVTLTFTFDLENVGIFKLYISSEILTKKHFYLIDVVLVKSRFHRYHVHSLTLTLDFDLAQVKYMYSKHLMIVPWFNLRSRSNLPNFNLSHIF